MTIAIHPELEVRLRSRAEADGLTVEAYVERLVRAEQRAEDELEALALEGLYSGEPIETGPGYWEAKHRSLDERLKKTGTR
ncbi:MAG: type II toxin-antitoxin system ParD family antitoxin [Terriglobia bacterium]